MASLPFLRSALCTFLGFVGLVEASGAPEASDCDSPRAVELLQLDSALQFRGQTELFSVNSAQSRNSTSTASSSYWYSVRGVDAGRSGYCPGAVGPFPLPAPAWSLEVPGLNFHQTPVIDDLLNIYTTSDNGTIFSFSKDVQKRWEFQPKSIRCQNPSLFDGKLYTACANGQVVVLRMDTGEEVWSRQVFDGLPTDAYTVSATEDFLVIPMADTGLDFGGAWGVALLDRADGRLRWSYNVSTMAPKSYVINLDPCILNESIILSDTSGGVYRLSVEDGSEIWRVPGLDEGTFTLGGVACAGDMVFNGYSRADGSGGLRALSIDSGSPKNKEWLAHIDTKDTANDVIIVAGDISHKWEIIRATLSFFKEHYGRVFYVPGNHELWGGAEEDSMQKLEKLLKLCAELHVETAPAEVATSSRRVLVVPLLSWHHPQWDTEPDIEGWQGLLPVDQMLSDYPLTHWPRGISIKDGTAAKAVDKINDRLMDWEQILARRKSFHEVLSFSHFLPRVEANPEKRYLSYPNLAKGIGSNYLRARVEALQPDVHVFGHTHFGYDLVVDGIRYVQAPLAMSSERQSRGTTVAVGDFPDGKSRPHPFLVWHSRSGWAPRCRGAAWSAYVERYGRRPDVTSLVPSYVADCGLEPISGIGGAKAKVGWLPGRMPVWFFGPREHRIREAAAEADKVAERLRKEAAGTFKRAGTFKHRKQQIGSDEPLPIEASEVAILMNKGEVAILDVREGDFASRPAGCVPLSHPSQTSNFAALPDAELLELGERMMTGGGPRILVGEGSSPASCRHAALLLAALLRLWPRDVRPLRGGFDAWVKQGLPVEPTGSLGHGGY